MPWNQPHKNSKTNITVIDEVAHGTKPIKSMMAPERIRPNGKKIRGLERSEKEPEMNLEKPYAIEIADRAKPKSALVNPSSCK